MDLLQVGSWRPAEERADLVLAPGESFVSGGTWLFSQPQPSVTGLVDLTAMGWQPCVATNRGLSVAATCTIEQLCALPATTWGSAAGLVAACARAFLMSFKVQKVATVGGNVALALPAGAMTSLLCALGADAVVWTADTERREPVAELVRGPGRTTLGPDEVLRAFEVPAAALEASYAFRRLSLTRFGRSGTVVVARRAGDVTSLVVTAATSRPVILPGDADATSRVDCWHDDVHGDPAWRAAMTRRLAAEALAEVEAASR